MKRITSLLLAIVLFAGLVLTAAPTVRAASEMTASDALVEILKNEEGFSAKPYWDYGQYTVGYGTRCPDDMLEEYQTNGISEEDAEVLLRNYLAGTESVINTKLIDKYGLTLTQNQFDALITFTYNCGSAWVYDTDGVLHNAVKNGTTGSEMIRVFSLWCSAGGQILPGLVRRRLCEANMYLNGVYSNAKPSNYGFVYYNANGGSVDYRIQGYNSDDGVAPAYTPVYSGHNFLGWYTDKTGGTKVTKLTADLSGDTLYARWDGTQEEQTPATPAEGVSVQVTATDVNLRKGPGTNYGIVGTANKGDTMVITETASGSGYEWGKAGEKWIALKYTNYAEAVKEQDKTPEETKPEEPTVPETTEPETTAPETTEPEPTTVTGTIKANGGLALRKGPGTGYERIKYLPDGMKVTILEQQKAGSMTWGRISEGWISMSYVVVDQAETKPETKPETTEPTAPETTTPPATEPETTKLTGTVKADGGLALRKGPGFGYARIKYIADGTKVTILEQKSDGDTIWGKISEGWISMKYVVLDKAETKPEAKPETKPEATEPTVPETTTPPAAEPETSKLTGTVKADGGLALRKGPGFNYARIKYIADGTKVTILEQKSDGDTTWGKISEGWISMKYVVLDKAESKPAPSEPTTPAEPSEPEVEETTITGTVKADGGLAVRGGAGLNYAIKKYLPNGSKVTVTEQKDVNGTKWGYMGEGWICMDYVK